MPPSTEMAPEAVVRAALSVLHIAGYQTRNWSAHEGTAPQIYDLWEALHVIPDLLCRWRPDAESELLSYFAEWDAAYPDHRLTTRYRQVKTSVETGVPY